MTSNRRIEELSELEHEQWMQWSKEVADKEKVSQERLDRWKKLWVPYKDLTELEKEADRAWARRVSDMITKRRKPDKRLAIFILILIIMLGMLFYTGYSLGKVFGNDQYKYYAYDMCRGFDFMAYMNTENMRHYVQNNSNLTVTMVNCEAYYHPEQKASISYDDWMKQNNLKHLVWNNCHTIIYRYDYPNNTFYQVNNLTFDIKFQGYDNDILRIDNTDYKFVEECSNETNKTN